VLFVESSVRIHDGDGKEGRGENRGEGMGAGAEKKEGKGRGGSTAKGKKEIMGLPTLYVTYVMDDPSLYIRTVPPCLTAFQNPPTPLTRTR